MSKLILHYQQWNRWRKNNLNSKFYKLLVLLKLRRSPTFEAMKAGEKLGFYMQNIAKKYFGTLDNLKESEKDV